MNEWTNRYHRACLKKRIYLHAQDIDDDEWRPVVEKSDELVDNYLSAFREHHSRRPDNGEYLVGRSLRRNAQSAASPGGATRASLFARITSIPKVIWKVPRTLVAWTYRKINAKLYGRIATITAQLESRIGHLERELAFQIAENKASAMHFRREIQMSSLPPGPGESSSANESAEGAKQHKPRAYPPSEDRIEAVA